MCRTWVRFRSSPIRRARRSVFGKRANSSGLVDVLELESVRIAEKYSVVGRAVFRIFRRRVEHVRADLQQVLVERIDVGAALGGPREVMQADGVAIVCAGGVWPARIQNANGRVRRTGR